MDRPAKQLYEFGPFLLDATERVLFREGEAVPLKPKVFDTLLVLVESSGHVLDKDELMKTIWPDTVVEENNLNQNISALRRALGEGDNSDQYIETLPRRGYRFVAGVRESRDEFADLVLEKHTLSSVVIEEEEHEGRTMEAGRIYPPNAGGKWWANRRTNTALALIAVLAAAVGYYFLFANKSEQPGTLSTVKSIAVLPFKPLGADANDEYLGLGMTDALITRLGSVSTIIVRPTSAVRKYGAQDQDPVTAGQQLSVDSVLDGSIQRSGDRLRLTVQLVSVADSRHLWSDKFDERFTDILTIEDNVSERVAAALSLRLTGDDKKRLTQRHTENPEAYQLYLKGQYFWNKRTEENLRKSKEYFEQAIARDPNCALAYGGLSDYYILIAGTEGPKETIPKAREAAAKALAIDETLAEPHTVLGFIKWAYEADWVDAEREFNRAIELNPNYELAHDRYGAMLSQMGRFEEALARIKRAQELDPFSLLINSRNAIILYRMRQYDQALEQCWKTLELDANYPLARWTLALIYDQTGMNKEAIAEIQRVITVLGRTDDNLAQLGRAYALAGNRHEATKILNELKELSKDRYVHPESIALVHASLGEKDQAFEWLDRGFQQGDLPTGLKVSPQWDALRSDSRFTSLLRRIGLAQ